MNFKLTSETKINIFGIKLFRIEATVSFGDVKKGDKGGWIEKEKNLYGNAWVYGDACVYGNARVSGDAWVYGDARVSGDACVYGDAKKTPICITGFKHSVTIQDKGINIGCEYKTFAQWKKTTIKEISEQHGKNVGKTWGETKDILFDIVKVSGRE